MTRRRSRVSYYVLSARRASRRERLVFPGRRSRSRLGSSTRRRRERRHGQHCFNEGNTWLYVSGVISIEQFARDLADEFRPPLRGVPACDADRAKYILRALASMTLGRNRTSNSV